MSNASPPSSSGPTEQHHTNKSPGRELEKNPEYFIMKQYSYADAEKLGQTEGAGQDHASTSIGVKQPDEEWDVIAEEEAAESRNARIPRGPVVIGRVGEKGSSRIIYLRKFGNKENGE